VAGRGWLALAEMRWTPPTWQVRFGWEVANSQAGLSTSTYCIIFWVIILINGRNLLYLVSCFIYLFIPGIIYLKYGVPESLTISTFVNDLNIVSIRR
jgi:hypothetical protein